MAVKSLVNWLGAQRADIPDIRRLESGVVYDFKTLIQSFQENIPYILKGFSIPVAGLIGNPVNQIQVVIDGAVVWVPGNIQGPFLRIDSGTANETVNSGNPKVVGSFAASSINYLGVRFGRATDPSSADAVNFWSQDAKIEFTRTVPRARVLNYEFVISTSSFEDSAPIAIIATDASLNVLSITNAKQNLFRLGTGGTNPDPSSVLDISTEENLLTTNSTNPLNDPFINGDWEIETFKQWMDAVMSEIRKIKGSAHWYSNGSSLLEEVNLSDLWFDTVGHIMTGVGKFIHDELNPGFLTWTSDIKLKSIIGNLEFVIPAIYPSQVDVGGKLAYIELKRHVDFQSSNVFTFTNGSATIQSNLTVTGIVIGDWIKFVSHNISKYAKVQNIVGSTITLAEAYSGASIVGKAVKSTYSYTVQVDLPEDVPSNANVFWLARGIMAGTDTYVIDSPANTGLIRTSDISIAKLTSAGIFKQGEEFTISGASQPTFDGRHVVQSFNSINNEITFYNPGPDVIATIAGDGIVARSSNKIHIRGMLELEQGEEINISDNTLDNILEFIGSAFESDITPPYSIQSSPISPYPITSADNLTQAISKLIGVDNTMLAILSNPAYEESLYIKTVPVNPNEIAPVVSGSAMTLPNNSRLPGIPAQFYTVGNGALEIYLNGQLLVLGSDYGWLESGTGNSDQIIIDQNLDDGDIITFRIDATGGPSSGASSSPDDDFMTLPTEAGADNSDHILIYDNSTGLYKKQTRASFLAGMGGFRSVNEYNVNHFLDPNSDDVALMDCSGGSRIVWLPADPSLCAGKSWDIKKIDPTSNSMTIDANGNFIEFGSAMATITPGESFTVLSSGSRYWIV